MAWSYDLLYEAERRLLTQPPVLRGGFDLELARAAEATLASAEWPAWSGRLTTELANLRAALSWALGGQDPEAGRELAARLARWWIATGRFSEAGQLLATALSVDAPADPQVRARWNGRC